MSRITVFLFGHRFSPCFQMPAFPYEYAKKAIREYTNGLNNSNGILYASITWIRLTVRKHKAPISAGLHPAPAFLFGYKIRITNNTENGNETAKFPHKRSLGEGTCRLSCLLQSPSGLCSEYRKNTQIKSNNSCFLITSPKNSRLLSKIRGNLTLTYFLLNIYVSEVPLCLKRVMPT